jgi:phage FluMu protein Com
MKTRLQELRCTCEKLLGKSDGPTEIKCTHCGKLIIFDNGNLINAK